MPRIEISGGPDAIRKLSAALAARAIPDLYVTSGKLVRIERVYGTVAVDLDDDMPLPVTASTLTTALLAKLLADHTYTFKWAATKDKAGKPEYHEVETTPSPGVLSAAIAGKEWPDVPVLAGIIGTPVLRRELDRFALHSRFRNRAGRPHQRRRGSGAARWPLRRRRRDRPIHE